MHLESTEIATLSLHDALPIFPRTLAIVGAAATGAQLASVFAAFGSSVTLLELAPRVVPGEDEDVSVALTAGFAANGIEVDRKSTRLNSSHSQISYADFCLKKK